MIRIEEIRIIRFGKFENFSLKATDGLNIIYGNNESGKSTVQFFIKAMLYGLASRKRAGDVLKDRERAIPWSGGKAEGVLVIAADDRMIEIRRSFGKTAAGDKFEACDSITGEKIDGLDADNVGLKILKMPADMFEKTVWINQNGAFMAGRDDEISKRLINLKTSGSEEISADSALEYLEMKKRSLKAKDGRSAKGRIDILEQRLDECRRERYELSTRITQNEETERRIAEAKQTVSELEASISENEEKYKKGIGLKQMKSAAECIRRVDECDIKLRDLYQTREYVLTKDLTEDKIEEAYKIEERLRQLEGDVFDGDTTAIEEKSEKSSTKSGVMFGVGSAFAVLGIAAAIFCMLTAGVLTAVVVLALLGTVAALAVFMGIRYADESKNIRYEIETKKEQEASFLKKHKEETDACASRLASILNEYKVESAAELSKLYASGLGIRERISGLESTKKSLLADRSYDDIKEMAAGATDEEVVSPTVVEEELKMLRNSLIEKTALIKELESRMAYQTTVTGVPSDIDTEIAAIKDEIAEHISTLSAISVAAEAIEELDTRRRSEITPKLNEKVNEVMKKLTEGRYADVRVAEDYRMRLNNEEKLFEAEYLSYGTYEQLYFALRYSVAELVCGDVPMFFDDILMSYDDERASAALDFLNEKKNGQVFLFTCRGFDREVAEQLGAHITEI